MTHLTSNRSPEERMPAEIMATAQARVPNSTIHTRPAPHIVLSRRDLEVLELFHRSRCETDDCRMRTYVLERLGE
ncbi:hypothetical protein HLB23_35620 [Nocardia uniformis]|uniref:Uncharacterized protein n=1 Tax=Nocardia uniformis TaxID=53432 RepID=A0A849C956_9NOCA|nr:hypothetical protein [Nocardia uniformis]NNH75122.1 hypothetical protein [Nocardia uniformis]